MISFEITHAGKRIQIEVDDAGIQRLVDILNNLRGSGTHIHLTSPSAGGNDLENKTPWGNDAVHEVIIGHGGD